MTFWANDDDGARLRAHLHEATFHDGDAPNPSASLTALCDIVVTESDLASTLVVLLSDEDTQAVAAVSGELGARVHALEFDLGEGPIRDAFAARRPVLEGDLDRAVERWPVFAAAATRAGIRGCYSFPLALGALQLGALALYSAATRHLTDRELAQCLVLADIAVGVLLDTDLGPGDHGASGIPALAETAAVRAEVYQAQGMVSADLQIGLGEALALLRARAFAEGISLDRLAIDVVARLYRMKRREP